ncbi:MAG: ATP-binding protein, partial [Anaerolineae bacterium]|nr:ATP-binding protein [Anaerolineae bacterium]
EGLVAWLLGRYRPHTALAGHLSVHQVPPEIPAAFVSADLAQALASVKGGLYLFHGIDADIQRAAAAVLAREHERLLMIVDLEHLIAHENLAPQRAVQLALREARLINALPMLAGWDACLIEEATPPELLYAITAFAGPAVIAGRTHWVPKGTPRNRIMIEVAFPVPDYDQRRELWVHFIGDTAVTLPGEALDALAGQFALTSGQIRDAVATARDHAIAVGNEREEPTDNGLTAEGLFAAARAHSNPRLAKLANKITPRYGWEDIILPDDQLALLHEIIGTVRGRPQVLDDWGLEKKLTSSRGVTVLFSGPPGTGKTMGAQIIAGELGLDLYRIDLSTVVSKYIGETEKNIERIFREAEQSNAILFFDEADALFGKRSEVRDSHDRYANIEVSYLLQRMEAYDGVTILATNLRGNLDEAFTRRLQFAVSFPFPEAEDRLRIWKTLYPSEVPRTADIDFELLAKRFKLAGGNIRNILVSAAYLAAADGGTLTMAHLLHSTRRELQKMGRLVNEGDLTIGTGSERSSKEVV